VILRSAADATPQPWRNGGGVTRELLRLPAGPADDWTLRISVADIEADGPFSPFPGVTRWFAAVAGAGVRLGFADAAPRDLRPGDAPLCFDGADAPGCVLLDGATRDLNVMVRRDRADVLVTAAGLLEAVQPGASTGFGFFALQAVVLHGVGAEPVALPALTLAWADSPFDASRAWSIAPAHAAREHTLPGYWIRLLPPAP
jgi:environmental stress-induced protein Ves